MKVTNPTWLWDAKLAWNSLSATHWIWVYGLEYGFRPIWPRLIIEVLAAWRVKFLEPSCYHIVINSAFIFCTTKVFGCFCCVMAQLKLINHVFPNRTTLRIDLSLFKSHMTEWSNTQFVSILAIMILPPRVVTYHGFNCFGYVIINVLHTSTYQNIANIFDSNLTLT